LEYYLDNFPEDPLILWALAQNYIYLREYDLARVELDRAMTLLPIWYFVFTGGDIHFYQGDLVAAEKEYRKLLEVPEQSAQIVGIERLAAIYTLQGRFDKTVEQFKQAIGLAENIGEVQWITTDLLRLAEIYLETGNPENALEELEKAWEIRKKICRTM
ncbi:MAG: tetratricopeptide repeat protein, partial [Deltaproteobacteria bacterium]|nr:tetratricopeptide repeat protein [Deltaproteobacteria bacterium]